MRVRQEVLRVVEVADELVPEGGEKRDDRQEGHDGSAPSPHSVSHYTRSLFLADERGIAFLEVLAAGVTLSIALIGLALMFSLGMSWVAAEGGERIALFLAQQRIEELRTMGLAGAIAEPERDIPGFPGFLRRTTITGGTDLDGSGNVPRLITVSVRSIIRQAGPVTVTTVYFRH